MTDAPSLSQLPDMGGILSVTGEMQGQLDGVLNLVTNFADMLPSDIGEVFNTLSNSLNIDTSDLTELFPAVMEEVQKALPPELQEKMDLAITGYNTLHNLLENADSVPPTALIQQMATALLQTLLALIKDELNTWAQQHVTPQQMETIQVVIVKVEQLQGKLPTSADEVVPFISENFLGISPETFNDPVNHLDEIVGVLGNFDPSAFGLDAAVPTSLTDVFNELNSAIERLQAAAEAETQEAIQVVEGVLDDVDLALQTIEGALETIESTVQDGYDRLLDEISQYNWNQIFDRYQQLLTALALPEVFSIDEVRAQFDAFLNSLSVEPMVSDLNARLQALQDQIYGAFDTSPLQDFRAKLLETLQTVQTTIEQIPTEELNALLDQAFALIQEQMNELHLNEIKDRILQGLQMLEDFITQNINDVMKNKIQTAINQALSVLDNFSLGALLDQLGIDDLIETQIVPFFDQVQAKLDEYTQKLKDMLARLDAISFKPVGDAVVTQINGVQTKLKAINPNALSAAEKMAIKGAVAVIENINLDQIIAEQVKNVYHQAEGEIKNLLGQVADLLNMVWAKIEEYGPDRILQPINDGLNTAVEWINKINADIVFDPLYEQVGKLLAIVKNFSPEDLLDPLQGYFDIMMDAIKSFDPAEWLEPVQRIYDQVVEMIGKLNPAPLFDEFAQQQEQFFADIKALILDGYDSAGIPAFIAGRLRPLVAGMAEAVLGDPNAEWRNVELDLVSQLAPQTVFGPLDGLFDQLMDLLRQAPLDDLVTTINRIYEILGTLSPDFIAAKIRELQDKFFALIPDSGVIDIGLPFDTDALGEVLNTFNARVRALPTTVTSGVTARIETIRDTLNRIVAHINPASDTSLLARLKAMYDGLIETLRERIDALDTSGAQVAYNTLMNSLTNLLPPFLRNPQMLTVDSFIEGFQSLRPSVLLETVGTTLNRLIGQLTPLQDTLETGLNAFLQKVREVMGLINPLSLRGPIEGIFNTIMAKIPSINLGEIATRLRDMLIAPIEQLNPAGIKPALAETYGRIIGVINDAIYGLLDPIRDSIDARVAEAREVIVGLVERVRGIINRAGAILKDLLARVKDLVFTEIIGRLDRLITQLGMSFDTEIDRVAAAFRNMLRAIPV
jgi:molecular chaperone GrpE (heat shock protein)